ncbi:MAG: hypothetical protein Q8P84_07805 [Deltaproteobacteria bacterium]|nr:hypothetical protein [Deltaproteobacteria bacterium]MDZ4224321.1 hypothetical protein [bacterium]
MKIGNNHGGVSVIAAMLMLLSLLALGGVISYLVAVGEESRASQHSSAQALYVTQAGVEYAVKKVYDGQSEIVNPPGQPFGNGSFTVSRSGLTLTITGTVGNAIRVHKIDSPTQADCDILDVDNATLVGGGQTLKNIYFRKNCLSQIVVDKLLFSWTPNGGQKLILVKIESSVVYDNPAGVPSGTLIDIADYVAVNNNNNVFSFIHFTAPIFGTVMTLTFHMGDGTTKTVTFGPLD